MQVRLTIQSSNSKTGPIPVSTTSRETCPKSCPWYNSGCYALNGPLKLIWNEVNDGLVGDTYSEFLEKIRALPTKQLWRHNQAGDLPGKNERINRHQLLQLVKASEGKHGFTYTHKRVLGDDLIAKYNRIAIREANQSHFTINLSADNLNHADQLFKLNIAPITTILPSIFTSRNFKTPEGIRGIVCPAYHREITCKDCKLCAQSKRRYLIGFPSHGAQKRTIDRTFNNSSYRLS